MPMIRRSPLSRLLISRRFISTTPAAAQHSVTLGIRREDPDRIWERRCPLTPEAVEHLVKKEGIKVLVQDCDRRVFPIADFIKAGAHVHPTLEPAHIVIGIKETPLSELVTTPVPSPLSSSSNSLVPRTHLMFSHTTKGQAYNMELLSRFLKKDEAAHQQDIHARLIDYELLVGSDGKRSVGFGWFAGVAGALESLSAMAHKHLEIGVASPFLHTPRPHTHPSIPSLRAKLREVGESISANGTPPSLGPFVICATGSGKVTQGVLDILQELPIVKVGVKDLPALVANPDTDLRKVYLVHALLPDYLAHVGGGVYSREEYYKHPENYVSEFNTKVAPYLTLLLNGVGWGVGFPPLMSNEQLVVALERAQQVGRGRFSSVGDISCDIGGGLEFLTRASTLSDPHYDSRPANVPQHLPGVQMMAVDILPSALPLDASHHFSQALLPYLQSLINEYKGEDVAHKDALDTATVARNGELQGKHGWLAEPLKVWKDGVASAATSTPATESKLTQRAKPKRVLLLGSGMVAGPAVDEICRRGDVELIVASNTLPEAERLVSHHSNAQALLLSMDDLEKVGRLIAESDVVIRAESAGVLLLNEIGLDPGIDHCSAISLLAEIRAQNKRVVSFTSFCGGLPAPESADVPLGYKFSWSPRGVLGAALNGARFKLGGKDWDIPGKDILSSHFPNVPISNILKMEGIANRDSLPYADSYDLGPLSELRTVLRGTLRYPGFCDLMHCFKLMGLLETNSTILLDDWTSFIRLSLQSRYGITIPNDPASTLSAIASVIPAAHVDQLAGAMSWLSLVHADSSMPTLPKKPTAPIDIFTRLLAHKLRYEPHERDMVVLSHEIVAQSIDAPGVEEIYTSSLITYGTAKASAMARTVGLPVAFAAMEVLDGKVLLRGVQGPTDKSVFSPVLRGLEEVGLGMREGVVVGQGMEDVLAGGLQSRI
ncbi:hypothetical protein HWV62_20442 [Athelia sp. TMB]|nr:hypothetical protein HWV62_20442 [Athelia sp. TMB]